MVTALAAVLGAWLLVSVVVSFGLAGVMSLSRSEGRVLASSPAAEDSPQRRQPVPA